MSKLFELKCYGYIEIEDSIFFPNLYFNGIVELNKTTGKIQNLYRFKKYGVRTTYLYSTVCKVDNSLIFVPNRSDKIAVFHLENLEISYFQLDESRIGKAYPYFRSAYEYNNYVYMFPSKASCIVKFEVKSGNISYIPIEANKLSDDMVLFRQEYEIIHNKVYLPFAEKGSVCIFDLETDAFRVVDLGIKQGFSTINYMKDRFWLSAWKEFCIYEWKEDIGIINKYENFPKGIEKRKFTFSYSEVIDNQLIYFPQQCNMIVSLDILTGKISCVKELDNWKEDSLITFCGSRNIQGFNIMVSYKKNILSIMKSDVGGEVCIVPYFEIDDNFNKSVIANYISEERGYFFCEPYQDLKKFLEMVKCEEKVCIETSNNCGKIIYECTIE